MHVDLVGNISVCAWDHTLDVFVRLDFGVVVVIDDGVSICSRVVLCDLALECAMAREVASHLTLQQRVTLAFVV